MFELLLITSTIALIFVLKDNDKYETVYSGDESTLSEANEYYWLLKSNNIPFKYQIPYNWENIYQFGYKKSHVYIKVSGEDVIKARQLIWCYRKERMKVEKNIREE